MIVFIKVPFFSEITVLTDLNGREQPQVKEHRTAVIRLLEDYLKGRDLTSCKIHNQCCISDRLNDV